MRLDKRQSICFDEFLKGVEAVSHDLLCCFTHVHWRGRFVLHALFVSSWICDESEQDVHGKFNATNRQLKLQEKRFALRLDLPAFDLDAKDW